MTENGGALDLRGMFDDLVRFETMLWAAVEGVLQAECQVSLASLNAMLVIERTPRCRILDVAEALSITVGGASQSVDRLEAAGRCLRRANPDDRRSSIIELTEDGERLLARAKPVFDDALDRWLRRPLDDVAVQQLAVTLTTLRGAVRDERRAP